MTPRFWCEEKIMESTFVEMGRPEKAEMENNICRSFWTS